MKFLEIILALALGFVVLSNAKKCSPGICTKEFLPVCATLSTGGEKQFANKCLYTAAKRCDPSLYLSHTKEECAFNGWPFQRSISSFLQTFTKLQGFIKDLFTDRDERRPGDDYN